MPHFPYATPPSATPRRRLAAGAAVALAALIAYLTLRSGGAPGVEPLPHGCLVCGPHATADAIANVALLVPLGMLLVAAGLRIRTTAALAACGAVAIELLQYRFVENRVATPTDVAANALGAALGGWAVVRGRAWLAPTPAGARRLWTGWLALWTAGWIAAAWALSPPPAADVASAPTTSRRLAHSPRHGWFAGRVLSVEYGGREFGRAGSGPVILQADDGRSPRRATLAVIGDDRDRPSPVPMLYVHPAGATPPTFLVAQAGRDAVLQVGMRARALRLRSPELRLAAAFPQGGPPDTTRLVASAAGGRLSLATRAPGPPAAALSLEPALGWTLVSPFAPHDPGLLRLLSLLWTAAWWLPIGYWGRRGAMGTRSVAVAAAAWALGALGAPLLLALPPSGGLALLAAVVGAAAGRALAGAPFTRPARPTSFPT